MYWILLLGLAAAWALQALLLNRFWRRGLHVTLRFCDPYLYEGDSSVLQEIVVNDKWLPLPALEVRLALSPNLSFTGEAADNSGITDQTYKRDIFSLLFHQQITRSLTFTAKRRGCYEVSEVDVKAFDFFFRPLGYIGYPQSTMIYVYPAQVDTRRLNIICTAITGTILVQNQLFPDPFEFSGIREYQPTDPMNRMNWKATVRMGAPMVNQFDSMTNLDLTLIFDLEDSHIWKADLLVEETIRIVSSLAARLVSARMPVEIVGNAKEPSCEESLFSMQLPAGGSHIAKLNQRLACINGFSMSCAKLLSSLDAPRSSENLRVLISKNTDAEIVDAVHKLSSGGPILWVIPKRTATELSVPDIPAVSTIIWEVN